MTERARRGLQDGGDRLATIARWLKDVPDATDVVELVLEAWAGDEPPDQIRRWPKGKVSRELAHEINDLISDHALDNGTTISARLSWVDTAGISKLSKKFRALCPRDFQETVFPLDGSSASMLSGNQRHTEAMVQKLIDVVNQTDARTERLFGFIDRVLERLDERATRAEEIADHAASQISEAEALAETATQAAEEAIKKAEDSADDDKVAKVIDIAFKRLTEGG